MSEDKKQELLNKIKVTDELLQEFFHNGDPDRLAFAIGEITEILPTIIQELSEAREALRH